MKDRLIYFLTKSGVRRTRSQKERFRKIVEEFALQVDLTFCQQPIVAGRNKGLNLILGNIDESDIIFVASYDTNEKIYSGDFKYYFNNFSKTQSQLRKNVKINLIISTLLMLVAFIFFYFGSEIRDFYRYLLFFLGFVSGVFSIIIVKGFNNKMNVTQTASILLAFDLAQSQALERGKVSFAFLDINSYIGLGLATFLEDNDLKNKIVIDLVSVCSLDSIKVFSNFPKSRLSNQLSKKFDGNNPVKLSNPLMSKSVKEYIQIAASRFDESGWYIQGYSTKNDVNFDEEVYFNVLKNLIIIVNNYV